MFLFDEPLSNLDAKLRVQMRAEIRELHHRLKTTTVYVTHDQIEAMTMADRIVVLQGGRIEQVGAPLDLYDRPANTFVAGFIGSPSMNILPGVVEAGGVRVAGALLPLPAGLQAAAGREVLYGIRPEHLLPGDVPSSNVPSGDVPSGDVLSGDVLSGTVAVVEPTGSETHVVLRLEGAEAEVVAMFRDRVAFRPGDRISLRPDAGKAHLFDRGSGLRL
ncbi:hypothetical protein MASR1M32_25890 [Rhodobacter sp.]